jgi:hypothetical protein
MGSATTLAEGYGPSVTPVARYELPGVVRPEEPPERRACRVFGSVVGMTMGDSPLGGPGGWRRGSSGRCVTGAGGDRARSDGELAERA